jgi:hypothetical protein
VSPASQPKTIATAIRLELRKLNDEQRVATGWVSIVEDAEGNQILDAEGHLVPVTELEKAVHDAFSESSGGGKGGDLHEQKGVLDVVESFVFTAEKRDALGLGKGPAGWAASFRVNDDDVWNKIKSGDRPELSLLGNGTGRVLRKRKMTGTEEAPILITDIKLNKLEWFSTVDRGASGDDAHRPRIVLWKRAQLKKQEPTMPMTLEEALATITDEEVKASIMEAIKAAAATPAAPPAPVPPVAPVPLAQRDDVPDDVKVDLQKRADETAELRKRDEANTKRIADLEDKTERVEIAKRVTSTMKLVPGEESDLVDLIKRVTDADSKAGEAFEAQLVTLSKAMTESPLLKAMGTSATDVNDKSAEVELSKRAVELRKVKPELSKEQSRQAILGDDGELYERLKEEKKSAAA